MASIDPRSDRAIYQQIADQIRQDIVDGRLTPGEQLPSERALMSMFDTARGTVRQAIAVLKVEGLIQSEHGKGVFVRPHAPIRRKASDRFLRSHREAGLAAFMAEAEGEGRTPRVEMLELGPDEPAADIASLLGLDARSKVLVRSRLYFADGVPVEVATSYLPWKIARDTPIAKVDTGPGGIYARLEEMGYMLGHFAEDVSARMPTPGEAEIMRLASGVPVIVVQRTAFTTEGLPVEVCDTTMAADRYVLSYQIPAV